MKIGLEAEEVEPGSVPPPPANPLNMRTDSANLDLIRAVAVLSVFFGHLYEMVAHRVSDTAWHFAQMGVLIFFVHTSTVLMRSLERSGFTGSAMFGSFYLRRFFRLYPLSVFCVTVAFLLHRAPNVAAPIRHWTVLEYLSNLALTTNLTYTDGMVGGLWTLPLEVQMYVALPFLFCLCRFRSLAFLCVVWAVSIPLAILQPMISGRLEIFSYAPCFMGGVIAWRLSRSVTARLPGWCWPLFFPLTWTVFFGASHERQMPYRWAFCLVLGIALPWFCDMRWTPLRSTAHVVAKYSYGVYLSHLAVFMVVLPLRVPEGVKWALLVVLAVTCPLCMYHFIESPMIAVGQRLASAFYPRSRARAAA